MGEENSEQQKKFTLLQVADRFQQRLTGTYVKDCSPTAKFFLGGLAIVAVGTTYGFFAPDELSSSQKNSETTFTEYGTAVGGPDYEVLGDMFIDYGKDSSCIGNEVILMEGETTSQYDYTGAYNLGGTFQFEVTPTGKFASNIAFGRHSLYELVIGDNTFEHLSLKDLRFVGGEKDLLLYRFDSNATGSVRISMDESISTSSPNAVRIEELVNKDGAFRVRIGVNEELFISEEMKVNEVEKFATLYIALLDYTEKSDERNNTGALFSELRLCK